MIARPTFFSVESCANTLVPRRAPRPTDRYHEALQHARHPRRRAGGGRAR